MCCNLPIWPRQAVNRALSPKPPLCVTPPPPQLTEESACGPVAARKDNVEETRSPLGTQRRQAIPQTSTAL